MTDKLPPLPPLPPHIANDAQFCGQWRETNTAAGAQPVYTASQMQDFARAVLAKWGAPAQAADSVLEDAARYRAFIECGQPICFMGEEYYGKAALDAAVDAAVDAARKQGGAT